MKNLSKFLSESIQGSAFAHEVKFSKSDFEKWKKFVGDKVEVMVDGDINLIYIGSKHVGTYNSKKQVLMTDNIEMFGH